MEVSVASQRYNEKTNCSKENSNWMQENIFLVSVKLPWDRDGVIQRYLSLEIFQTHAAKALSNQICYQVGGRG